jgi:YVTN family beta-propeller protein
MFRSLGAVIVLGSALALWPPAASAEVTATIPLGKGKPNRVVFHPDGKTAWVVYETTLYTASGENKSVIKVDTVTKQATGAIPIPDVVTVIDVKTHRQIQSIPVGKAPHGMALRPR